VLRLATNVKLALGISISSLFGVSPVTAFIESGAGISEGGKTGITAVVTGICFFISIFFAPIFASIPPWATGCTLIIVGAMMASAAKEINWLYFGDALPAFITLAVMPFTYSIADGLIAGIISYIFINTVIWLIEVVTRGRIVPADKHLKEAWTYKIKGGLLPAWVVRMSKGLVRHAPPGSFPRSPTLSERDSSTPASFQNHVLPSSTDASTDVDIEMESRPSQSSHPSNLRIQSYIMPSNTENSKKDFWKEEEAARSPSSDMATQDGIERVVSGSDEVDLKQKLQRDDEKLA